MTVAEILELEKEVLRKEFDNKIRQLELESDLGNVGDMKWLKETTSLGNADDLKTKILYPFRGELEGKVVSYPHTQGKPWKVNKWKFKIWMDENFERIEW